MYIPLNKRPNGLQEEKSPTEKLPNNQPYQIDHHNITY